MGEIKLVLVGVGGVGKSALAISYVSNTWVPEYDPTIEDSHRKQVSIDDQVSMLDILDTAGQEEYATMQDQWFRTGQGFLLVYSITSKKAFQEISDLRRKILLIKDRKKVPMVLIANKCDLEAEREVSKGEGEQLATTIGCPFMEASAKNRINVDDAFKALVREVRKANQEDKQNGSKPNGTIDGKKILAGCQLL